MKAAGRLILFAVLALLLSGCTNYLDLNRLEIVAGIAIDRNEEGYNVALELLNLTETDPEGALAFQVAEFSGKTIPAAMENAKGRLTKELYFGNLQTIVISRQIAEEEGIASILDWFMRDSGLRETSMVVLSTAETAKAVLEAKGEDMAIAAFAIEAIVNPPEKEMFQVRDTMLYRVYNAIHIEGKNIVLMAFDVNGSGEKAKDADQGSGEEKAGAEEDSAGPEESVLGVSGIGLFNGDRLVGFLPQENLNALLVLREKGMQQTFAFPVSQGGGYATFRVSRIKSERHMKETGGGLTLCFDVKATGLLIQAPPGLDMSQRDAIESLQQDATAFMKEYLLTTAEYLCRELKVDAIDAGYEVYKMDGRLWQEIKGDWDRLLPQLPIEINMELHIAGTGSYKAS
ncbi:MAG: Ger(x)C family spore germination protein [Clostridiales bacterium]